MTGLALLAAAAMAEPLFFNIAPYSSGWEKTVAADMREYVARTGNRKVLYSLTLHPEGVPAMGKVEEALASYRRLKGELEGSDVELGILLQAIMGHWPRTDKAVEPWQRTVDSEGNEVRFCWLDGRYRDYIRTVAGMLAAEKPCFILGDDDIRAFSPRAECFCPLHVKEFNRRRGTDFTSEEMRAAVKASAPGSPDFETFMALQREQVNGVVALIREGIDSVDPTICAGTCMPTWESRFNDQAARAIAAKGQPPVMRLGNANYQEWRRGMPWFCEIVQKTQALAAYHHDRVGALISEADTYPHHLWSRASTSWHAYLVMSFFAGLKGAKLWYVNAHKGDIAVNRNYTDRLAENAGLYRTLARELADAERIGLLEPCLTRFPKWHPLRNPTEGFVAENTWAAKALGRMGIPYAVTKDYANGGAWTLAGDEAVMRMSDGDLKKILSHKVLVDGQAALALAKRGFSDLIGVRATRRPLLFNGEVDVESGQSYQLTASDNVPSLECLAGAQQLTSLVYRPYAAATSCEDVAPGTVLFRNPLGGTVAVSAFHMGVAMDRICSEARQDWLFRVVDALVGERAVPCIANRQDVSVLAARRPTGEVLLAVFNLNYDPLTTIDLRVLGAPAVSVLGGDGIWRLAETRRAEGVLRVLQPLPCYGTAVLRLAF